MNYDKKPLWQLILIYLIVGGLVYAGIYYYFFPTTTTTTKTESVTGSQISLTDAGYSPVALTIDVGETVNWVNSGSKPATVNSDPHPAHTDYPPLNLGKFEPGSTLSLKFDVAGTYTYHNHLNASQTGTIVVK